MDHPPETNSLLDHLAALKDPRQRVKVIYSLPEILLLILCASIAAADDFVVVQYWGETHMDFLRRFLPYNDGIPSNDALNDLMNALDTSLSPSASSPGQRLERRRSRHRRGRRGGLPPQQ
jgi:hypothetical protein